MPKIFMNKKSFIKKLSLIFLSSVLFLNSMIVPFAIKAQDKNNFDNINSGSGASSSSVSNSGTWYNQDFKSWLEKVDDDSNPSEIFGERYTSAQVQWIIYSLLSFLVHTTLPSDVVSCVFSNSGDLSGCKDSIENFLNPKTENKAAFQINRDESLISLIFTSKRPISGIGYVKEKINKFGFIPEAQAQNAGFGFDALKPVQEMWKSSRDVAFGLFVLMAIIFAFMIMFRVKISPQLVISAQSAIPKVITALILATFSYAIAGFLVDLMYVFIGIVSIIISTFIPTVLGIGPSSTMIFSMMTLGQPGGDIGGALGGAGLGSGFQLGIMGLMAIYLGPLVLMMFILTVLGIFASPFTAGISFFVPFIILIIVIIVALWITIKTVWMLLKAFVNVLLLTIFAPLQLTLGALVPSVGFGAWVKSYLSNLSVFVVTGVLYWFSVIFLLQGVYIGLSNIGLDILGLVSGNFFGQTSGAVGIANTIADYKASWPPLLGSGNEQGVGLLFLGVSFVLFTLIPKATEIVQGFISGKPFAYGSAIGESITQPFTTGLRVMTAAQQIGTSYSTRFGTRKAGESQEKATNLNDERQPPAGTTSM